MKLTALLVATILAASVTVPNVFSDKEGQHGDSDKKEKEGNLEFDDSSATTNLGQQISDLIHKRNELLKQEHKEIHDVLKSCKALLKHASHDQKKKIMQDCVKKIKEIIQKYKPQLLAIQQQIRQLKLGIEDDKKVLTEEQNKNFFKNAQNNNVQTSNVPIKNSKTSNVQTSNHQDDKSDKHQEKSSHKHHHENDDNNGNHSD